MRKTLGRMLAGLGAALSLTSCNQMHLGQQPGKVVIRHGELNALYDEVDYATPFVPYALMSLHAYDESGKRLKHWDAISPQVQVSAERWLDQWELIDTYDSHLNGNLPCDSTRWSCKAVGGLGFQVWVRKDCSEAVVAFRGTNFTQWEDWISNFRWVTRVMPVFDQYEQVQDNVARILSPLRQHRCWREGMKIVATGHSLGGGLAQQLAYMASAVRHVVVFNPSSVTGYYGHRVPSKQTSKGLVIDRVYEHGEVLAYLRLLIRTFYPNSAKDPMIRTLRFNVTRGNVVSQHSMAALASALLRLSGEPPGRPLKPLPCDPASGACPPAG